MQHAPFTNSFLNQLSTIKPQYPQCLTHNSPLTYICFSEDCVSKLFCECCIYSQHKDHINYINNVSDLLEEIPNERTGSNSKLFSQIKQMLSSKEMLFENMNMNFIEGENLILNHFDHLKARIIHLLDLAYKYYWNSITEINQTSIKEIENKMKKMNALLKLQELKENTLERVEIKEEELQSIAKYISKNKNKLNQLQDVLQGKVKEIDEIVTYHNFHVKHFDSQKFKEYTDSLCTFVSKTFGLRESFQDFQADPFNSFSQNPSENNEKDKTLHKNYQEEICSVRILNKHLVATAGCDPVIKLWDMQSGECISQLEGHKDRVWCVLSAYEGKYLVSGSRDKTIKVWKLAEKKCKKTFRAHTKDVLCLEYLKDQKILASGSLDSSIILWDMQQGKVSKTLSGHKGAVWALEGLVNGNLLSSGDDSCIRIWDIRDCLCLKTINGHKGPIFNMATFNEDRNLLTCSSDETIRVWSLEEGTCLQIVKAHDKGVRSLAINSSETLVVTGGHDKSLKIWDLQSLKLLRCQENNDTIIRSAQFYDEFSILYGDRNLKIFKLNVA